MTDLPALPPSPYKGLAAFDDSDQDALFFFGRERDSEIIVANLLAARLTVLYGPSGVGKSSVLGACVARRLRHEPDAEVIVVSSWAGGAAAPVREALDAAGRGRDVYLILDQFEEYFLYHAREEGPETLAESLPDLLLRSDLRVNVLISVREDAIARLDAFKARIPNVLANYLRLPHLDRAGGRAAIVCPLERWSDLAGEGEAVDIEPALVDAVLDQTATGRLELGGTGRGAVQPGGESGQVEAPILQLVMHRLWDAERARGSRTLQLGTFVELGGAEAVVRDQLERAVGMLEPDQQDVAASVFDHLVTPSGSKVSHRGSDLAEYAHVEEGALTPVLSTLEHERILRSVDASPADGGVRYEIFHDVLADAVLAWRSDRRVERERQSAARRHRRLAAIAAAALAALALVSAVALFALVERSREHARARQAAARELEASALLGLQSGSSDSVALALRAARLEPDARAEDVLRQTLMQSRLRSSLPAAGPVRVLQFRSPRRLLVAGGSRRILFYEPTAGTLARVFRDPATVTAAVLGPGSRLLSGDVDGHVLLRNETSGRVLRTARGRGAVTSVAFGRGGLMLFTTAGGSAAVWRPQQPHPLSLTQPGPVVRGIFDPAGHRVATIAVDARHHARARVFDLRSGKLLYVLPQLGVQAVAFSPGGSLLATGSHSGAVDLWRPRTGRPVRELDDGGKNVLDLAFSPNGSLLATASGDGAARVWTVASGTRLYYFPGHTNTVQAVAWSPDERLLADASRDGTARLYAIQGLIESGEVIATLPGNSGGASAIAFGPNGVVLATGAVDGGIRLWDARAEERLMLLGVHPGGVASAVYSPDGRLVVSAGADRTARIWDVRRRRLVHVLHTPQAARDARFSPDGSLVVTASDDGAARIWRVRDGGLLRTLGRAPPLRVVRFSPDGKLVAAGSGNGSVGLWRVSDASEERVLRAGGRVDDVEFSPDGHMVATASSAGAALWSADEGALLRRLPVDGAVLRVAFSPDGSLLATAGTHGTAMLWDADTGRLVRVLRGHRPRSKVTDVVFSPDGKLLLTTSSDTDGRIWAVPSGAPLELLRGQFGVLTAGAFSADGRWAATADGLSAVIWPTATGRLLFYLRGHTAQLTAVSFSPGGTQLLTASVDGTVRTYDCEECADLPGLEQLAEARLARSRPGG
jgi:WD40 repeat protein